MMVKTSLTLIQLNLALNQVKSRLLLTRNIFLHNIYIYMMSDNELVKTVFAFVLWDSHNALPFRAHMAHASPWCLDRGRAGESPVYPLRDSL